MNDPRAMRGRKRGCDLRGDIERLAEPQACPLQSQSQRLAIDKLHRNEMLPINFINLINVSDVRMIERCGRLCFLHKAPHAIFISDNVSGQNFQRHFAIELRVLREIHFPHSARADLRADFIATEARS